MDDRTPDDRAPTPAPADLAITHITVLVHDEAGAVDFAADQDILISQGTITSVSPSGAQTPSATEVIDGTGMLAMPGFINCHAHSPMVMFRGAAEDVSEARWFNELMWPMEVNITADDVELAMRLAVAEMIRSGTTTFADHYFHMDRIAKVVEETGQRAVLGPTYFGSDGQAGLDSTLAWALENRGSANGRITTALAPHAPYTVGDDDLRWIGQAAAEHDLLVHIHASENRVQAKLSRERHGKTPVAVLDSVGMFDARVLIAHGMGLVEDDIAILQAAREVGVGSAPKGYLKNGFDTTPVRMLRGIGVPVGLATDGAASNNTLDVWESMTFLGLVQKAREEDQTFLTAREVLHHATIQSAQTVGLADSIGRLAPGYKADVLLVDLSAARLQPIHDLASTLVYSGHSDDIDTTIVDGIVLMRGKKVLTVDTDAVVAELTAQLPRLTDVSHGRQTQSYDT